MREVESVCKVLHTGSLRPPTYNQIMFHSFLFWQTLLQSTSIHPDLKHELPVWVSLNKVELRLLERIQQS